jgi:FixJ family two-component response regulator
MKPTVFVVDDDSSVLSAVARLIRSAGHNVEVFASPQEFLDRAPSNEPGCLVVDLRMPELSGLELQNGLIRAGCGLPVIFMSGQADIQSTVKAMQSGAVDFLIKPFDEQQLLDAIDRAIAHDVKERAARAERHALRVRLELLTPREREVCMLVAAGRLNKQIAAELGIAEKTVKAHRARVMAKLDAPSVAELVRIVERAREPETNTPLHK